MSTIRSLVVKLGADNKDLESGLKKARSDIERFNAAVNSVANKMTILGGASTAAAGAIIKSTMEWAAAVNDLEDKTNMSAEASSRLLYIAETVGLSVEDMGNSMAKMAKSVMTAAQAQASASASGSAANDVFTRYGIVIHDVNGKLLSQEEIFQNIVRRHREMANGLEKTNMEMEIFGRSGAKLNDLLNLTDGQMASMANTAERCGLVLSHETTQAWEDLTFQMNECKLIAKGVAAQLGNQLLPVITDVIGATKNTADKFSHLTKEQKITFQATLKVTMALGGLGGALRAVTFTFGPLVDGTKTAIKAFGALRTAATAAYASIAALLIVLASKAYMDWEAYNSKGIEAIADDETKGYLDSMQKDMESRGIAKGKWAGPPVDDTLKKAEETKTNIEASSGGDVWDNNQYNGIGSYSGSGESAEKKAEKLREKIKELKEDIDDTNKSAAKLAEQFRLAGDEISRKGLSGAARVKADIEAEYGQRERAMQEWVEQYAALSKEAADTYAEALKTGDETIIENAKQMLEQRKADEIAAAQEIAQRKLQIEDQLQQELNSRATAKRALEEEMKYTMQQGDMSGYMAAAEQRLAMDSDEIAQRQELMQQYYDWRQQSEVSNQELMLNALNTFKDGFASAFANAIVYAKDFKQAIVDLTKQVIATYIQQRVQAKLSSILASSLRAKETAQTVSSNMAIAASGKMAAYYQALMTGGANIITGQSLFLSALTVPFATGGLVTKPTMGLVGEVTHRKEGVFPLTDSVFEQFAEGIVAAGGGTGDMHLHISAMDAASFENFLATKGGKVLRQAFSDWNREALTNTGVW